ncbi:MAG: DUF697 domain-containing protein [Oscillatoria sp. SIO1A7]|nr:DUF697 domain-containing protein [Oscillatoria sp. SIO1A7]
MPHKNHLNTARSSIRQALSWYSHIRRHPQPFAEVKHKAALQTELEGLRGTLEKLDREIFRIAAFGLVSRGKSAVLNATIGRDILPVGPINGVTQWPRSVQWMPEELPFPEINQQQKTSNLVVELIDTPGLDEVDGQARSQMARDVARQADLILFVVAGDINRTEYDALCELRAAGKPIVLVFNKIDLYPEQDRQAIYEQLQSLSRNSGGWVNLGQKTDLIAKEDIVMVAAEPTAMQVRVEWPDGTVGYEWETPPPQMEELKEKILEIVRREGRSLLALNALAQARDAETNMASIAIEARSKQAENLINKFAGYKALAVALNPIAVVDVLGGSVADLLLIRSLAKLYGLPMTGYEAGKLWKQILFSGGGLLVGEAGSGLLLGLSKSAAAVGGATGDGVGLSAYAGAAIAQATMAGYGTYKVGQAAQVYLERGCTWGPSGSNTAIREILSQVDEGTVCDRLRQDLLQHFE